MSTIKSEGYKKLEKFFKQQDYLGGGADQLRQLDLEIHNLISNRVMEIAQENNIDVSKGDVHSFVGDVTPYTIISTDSVNHDLEQNLLRCPDADGIRDTVKSACVDALEDNYDDFLAGDYTQSNMEKAADAKIVDVLQWNNTAQALFCDYMHDWGISYQDMCDWAFDRNDPDAEDNFYDWVHEELEPDYSELVEEVKEAHEQQRRMAVEADMQSGISSLGFGNDVQSGFDFC